MKRVWITLAFLAVLGLWSTAALADTYSYDYLFTGSAMVDGVSTGGVTDVPLTFSFDTAAIGVRSNGVDGNITYLIPFTSVNSNGLSLMVGGVDLFDQVNFDFSRTGAMINIVDGILNSLDISLHTSQNDLSSSALINIGLHLDSVSILGNYDYYISDLWTGAMASGSGSISGALSSPTPIPGAVILLGSGLFGLVGLRRRKA